MQVKDRHKDRRGNLLLGILCLVLQVALSPNLGMGNGHVDFCLIFAGVYALLVGGRVSVVMGFCAGLAYDMLSTGPVGLMALLLTVFSYVLGIEERNRFADGYVAPLSSFGVGSFVVVLAYHLTMLLLGVDSGLGQILLLRTLPTFAMTFVGFLPFAYLQVQAAGRGHGLGSGMGSRGLRGSHYDIRNL